MPDQIEPGLQCGSEMNKLGHGSLGHPESPLLKKILDAMPDGVYITRSDCRIEYLNPALESLFGPVDGRTCHEYFHQATVPCAHCKRADIQAGRSVHWEWRSPRTDRWYEVFETPLPNSDGSVSKLTFLHDIDDRRKLEREVAEVSTHERQLIGQELHDRVGQQLLGLRLLSASLHKSLQSQGLSQAVAMAEITAALEEAQNRVRQVIKGVRPVDVDAGGLMAALAEFCEKTEEVSAVCCAFRCKEPVPIDDNRTATELFHIAQEAVTNALKHARPTRIDVGLGCDNERVVLWVCNDGSSRNHTDWTEGMGLRIMRHRAGAIGATLRLQSSEGAAIVTCTLPLEVCHRRDGSGDGDTL